jgi:hypothetical protein
MFLVVIIMKTKIPTQETKIKMMAKTILGRQKGGGQGKAKRHIAQRA